MNPNSSLSHLPTPTGAARKHVLMLRRTNVINCLWEAVITNQCWNRFMAQIHITYVDQETLHYKFSWKWSWTWFPWYLEETKKTHLWIFKIIHLPLYFYPKHQKFSSQKCPIGKWTTSFIHTKNNNKNSKQSQTTYSRH